MSCWCGEIATLRCSACSGKGSTGVYCSPDHQKIYYKFHKTQCKSDAATPEGKDTIILVLPLEILEYQIRGGMVTNGVETLDEMTVQELNHSEDLTFWNEIKLAGDTAVYNSSPDPQHHNLCFGQARVEIIRLGTLEQFKCLSTLKTFPFYYITDLENFRLQLDQGEYLLPLVKEFFHLGCMLNMNPKNKSMFKSIKICINQLKQLKDKMLQLDADKAILCLLGASSQAIDAAIAIEAAYGAFLRYEITEEILFEKNIELIKCLQID